jgi:hypothetical protein
MGAPECGVEFMVLDAAWHGWHLHMRKSCVRRTYKISSKFGVLRV